MFSTARRHNRLRAMYKVHKRLTILRFQWLKKRKLLQGRIKQLEEALACREEEVSRLAESDRYHRGRWLTTEREVSVLQQFLSEEDFEGCVAEARCDIGSISQARPWTSSSPYC